MFFNKFSKRYKLLRNLVFIQISSILIGLIFIFVTYQYILHTTHDNVLSKNKTKVYSELDKHQDKWRAWYQLGLKEALDHELKEIKQLLNISTLEVIKFNDLKETDKKWEVILPSIDQSNKPPPFAVVVAKLDPKDIALSKLPNEQLLSILVLSAFMFLYIVFFSANYLFKKVHTPIIKLGEAFDRLSENDSLDTKKINAEGEIRDFLNLIQTMYETVKQNEKSRALSVLYAQVAHDIRSPLAALNVLSADSTTLNEDSKGLIKTTTLRIQNIANELLNHSKAALTIKEHSTDVGLIIENLIKEKKIQFSEKRIDYKFIKPSSKIVLKIDTTELERMLSNLVNNAIESIEKEVGSVSLQLGVHRNETLITITDTGKGIPSDIIPSIGNRGNSFGKKDGTGLGVWHAKTTVEKWGGSIKFSSALGTGTSVLITIPNPQT